MNRLFNRVCQKRKTRATKHAWHECSEHHFTNALDQVCRMRQREGGARFLQIGANDGYTNDPLYPFIERYQLAGYCIEPLPAAFELLQETHVVHPAVTLVQAAIGTQSGTMELFMAGLPDDANEEQWLDATRKATFSKETALRKTHKVCRPGNDAEAERRLQCIPVPSKTLRDFLEERGNPRIDILQIDAEGEDWNILRQVGELHQLPTFINLEHKGLTQEEQHAVHEWFARFGYLRFEHGRDTCGVRIASQEPDISPIVSR